MTPLVSILIPAYNAEAWITDTIQSARAQTWPRKEIIIVDDGSKDRTLAVARRFESDTVKVVTQSNQGAAAARNIAFSLSKGDYIQWLDADDLLAPDKIETQMEFAEQCDTKRTLLSSEWAWFMYRPSRAKFIPTALWNNLSPVEWLLRKMGNNLHMQPANWLVSRELTETAGAWDTRLSLDDDGEYFSRVLLSSAGTRFVPEAKSYYRMSSSASLSKVDRSDKKLESQFLSMQLHIRYLLSLENTERSRAACVRYLQNWVVYFFQVRMDIVEELQKLANSLGGELQAPRLRPKYAWLAPVLGWETASRAQSLLPEIKTSAMRQWDKAMHQLNSKFCSNPSPKNHS